MNHPARLARGGFCISPNESNHDMSIDASHARARSIVMGCVVNLDDEPPTVKPKLCNVTNSYLKPSATKMDRTFESNEYTSIVDSAPGRPTRRGSMGTSPSGNASPRSVTSFVDSATAKCIPMLPDMTKKNSVSKRVRFQVDDDGDIDEDVSIHSFPKHQLTAEDIRVCWYGREERKQLKGGIPSQCRDCIHNLPEYRRAALKVCALASRHEYASLLDENRDALRILAHEQARGLERSLFARMNLPRKSSKNNVYAVLHTQRLIRELTTAVYTYDEVAMLISEQYNVNSQYAIRWALILAEADAADAQKESDVC
jgi:hypothetical protein